MPAEYRALWDVPGGGTGYSVLHFDDAEDSTAAQAIADNVRAFFLALTTYLPDDVSINFDTEVVNYALTGGLTSVFAVTPPLTVDGASTTAYSRAAGGRVDWGTGAIVAGRRLVGRTYIVPMTGASFDNEGLLGTGAAAALQGAADALIADSIASGEPLEVWSRTHAQSIPVSTASVPAFGAILRGRRD